MAAGRSVEGGSSASMWRFDADRVGWRTFGCIALLICDPNLVKRVLKRPTGVTVTVTITSRGIEVDGRRS